MKQLHLHCQAILILWLAITFNGHATSDLPTLETKQTIDHLRFISKDGKFTYFQLRSGSLRYSTNYNVHEVITGVRGDHYEVIGSSARKKIAISKRGFFHQLLGVRNIAKIYISNFNTPRVRYIASGISPQLHLDDQFISVYHPENGTITIIGTEKASDKSIFKLKNRSDPFFIPQVVMLSAKSILYTDLSSTGATVILHYNRTTKRSKLFWRSLLLNGKIEICRNGTDLFIGQFGRTSSYQGSTIWKMDVTRSVFDNSRIIYRSKLNDIGNIICNIPGANIHFISDISRNNQRERFEAVSLHTTNHNSKKIVLSDIKEAGQLLNLDGRLLLPFNGKLYVLLGTNSSTITDALEESGSKKGKKKK
ncbi:MAG: hypothetical protein HN353_02960 [Bdellovibrionales bacterium]|jgi:hypothetical protein|nr:hypothetical protein [Bdellovibrionales bacterium]MBT3527134.1 hypothetical protein [Bdellovibrionales bacterium]MBT7669411.1 hypothetical protein [Bdellovibrionales bacterium]MBT7767066.1 hypothetical protein [Bdellovibrionales bacterium]